MITYCIMWLFSWGLNFMIEGNFHIHGINFKFHDIRFCCHNKWAFADLIFANEQIKLEIQTLQN